MSIKLGTQNIIGLYKGNTEIIKRYKGNNLVYESFLPYSFEYLYNSYIPTTINNKTVKDKLRLNKIYANAVIENQLCQDNFGSSTSYWARNRVTQTNNNNIATFVSNSNAYNQVSFYHSFSAGQLIKGHKYLVSIKVKLTSGLCSDFRLYMQNDSTILQNPQLNVWYNLSFIWTNTRENTQTVNGIVTQRTYSSIDDIVIDSDSFEAKEPQLIDLTLREGPGNEPTSLTDNRIQALLNEGYIEYNTGSYKGTNIGEFVSEPYNLFDGVFERGDVDSSTGEDTTDNRFIRSVSFIKVIAGQPYSLEQFDFAFLTSAQRKIVQFDENKNVIKATTNFNNAGQFTNPYTITLENNCYYIRIVYYNAATQIPLDLKCAFHLTGTRTGYAPHTQSHTLPFIYQGNSALNAHDTLEITNTEYVFTKNISKVDLGTLNWTPYTGLGDTKLYWATISDIKLSSNLLCSSLTQVPAVYNTGDDYSISSHPSWSRVYARTTNAQATASDFKTAMSGIMLYYELATPQVVCIPKKHLAVVDLGTLDWSYNSETKRFSTNGVKSSIKHEYGSNNINIYCKNYSANSSGDRVIWCGWNGEVNVNDSSYTDATTFKNAILGTYLFYETQDEVADIISNINIEAGGTLTSNWFSWIENQLSNPTPISQTINGLVFTNNGDGSYTVDGTATADTTKSVGGTFSIISGHYYLICGGASGGSNSTYRLLEGYTYRWNDTDGNGYIQNATAGGNASLIIDIKSGTTCNNLVFKPQFIDLTLGFGEGKEPTSINDPRIQYIIKQGYIPTNTTGTNKTIASKVLPNIDASFNRK